MFRKGLFTAFFICFFLALPGSVRAMTLGYVEFPPYEFQNQQGEPQGALIEIVQAVFKKAGVALTLVALPFKRAYEETKSGKIDGLFNFYKTEERIPFFDYSDPIIKNPLVFFVRKDATVSYQKLEDLQGLKVGVMTGYTYGPAFDHSSLFKREPSNSHESNFKKLVLGRLDMYACDKLVGIYVAVKNGLMSELKILPVPLKVMEGYIGFTKGKHGAEIAKINKAINEMEANGRIESIIDAYVEANY